MSNERELIIWSVAWGDYAYMLQALVTSLRRTGFDGKIVVFCDRPIQDAEYRPIDPQIDLDQLQFWKFEYLCKHMAVEPGLDLVFIDSDHYVVRNVSDDLPKLIADGPWHSFLEGPINTAATRRTDWWGCPNSEFIKLCRDFGVMQKEIRNSNGGFWAIRSEFAETSRRVAKEFHEFARKRGYVFPEEVSIAVMSHMFSEDHTNRFAEKWSHLWGSEWTGTLQDRLPDGNPWKLVNYMSGETSLVNPAIVHAMRSKSALVSFGKGIAGDEIAMSAPQQIDAPSPGIAKAIAQNQNKQGCSACARKRQQMLEAAAKSKLEEGTSPNQPVSSGAVIDIRDEVVDSTNSMAENAKPESNNVQSGGIINKLKEMIKG